MKWGGQLVAGGAIYWLAAAICCGQSNSSAQPPEPAGLAEQPARPVTGIAPLTMGERAKYALNRSFSPTTLGAAVFTSGFQTWRGNPEAWGQDWEGYIQRFGMRMGRSVLASSIEFGVGAALGTDPRYRRLGKGSVGTRMKYAVGASFYHHDVRGGRVPAISRFAGIAGANIISNYWMPDPDNKKIDVVRRCGQQVGWHVGWTVLKEFLPDIKRKLRR